MVVFITAIVFTFIGHPLYRKYIMAKYKIDLPSMRRAGRGRGLLLTLEMLVDRLDADAPASLKLVVFIMRLLAVALIASPVWWWYAANFFHL